MGRAVALKLSDVPNNKRNDHDDKSERRKSNPNRRCETFAQLHRKLHQEIEDNHWRVGIASGKGQFAQPTQRPATSAV